MIYEYIYIYIPVQFSIGKANKTEKKNQIDWPTGLSSNVCFIDYFFIIHYYMYLYNRYISTKSFELRLNRLRFILTLLYNIVIEYHDIRYRIIILELRFYAPFQSNWFYGGYFGGSSYPIHFRYLKSHSILYLWKAIILFIFRWLLSQHFNSVSKTPNCLWNDTQ